MLYQTLTNNCSITNTECIFLYKGNTINKTDNYMTISLEKVFFKYILMNKNYLQHVHPDFFKNPEIGLVYKTVHDYMSENIDADIPRPAQIYEMVALVDRDKRVSKQAFKIMVTTDLSQYDEVRFIKPKLHAWILIENIKLSSDAMIDKTREIESGELELERVEEIASQIREIVSERTMSNYDDSDDLGSDFDVAENHIQDHGLTKVRTGWASLDSMLNGGLDISTLNILMGSTNSGKCAIAFYINIRNKTTNKVEKMLIEDFFKLCTQKRTNNI